MQRSLRLSLSLSGSAALALANTPLLPAVAQDGGSAEDLGVMEINLKDAVKFNWGFQGALQGAGTPNQAGIGGFLPLSVSENSVFFADVLLNANFADYGNDSSIVNTEVAGTTISTSSRLGYRWLNNDLSWMFGVNAGYDSRPMNTGNADTGVDVTGQRDVFFQQVAAGLEAVSESWNFNAYALIPVGTENYRINSNYFAAALETYGLDVGYSITPNFRASVGYYYQQSDLEEADGSGVEGRLAYGISDGLTAGINLSYDQAFETRLSADIQYRFGANSNAAASKKKAWNKPTIQALSDSVKHRNVRVHDKVAIGKTVKDEYTCTSPTKNNLTNGPKAGTKPVPGFAKCARNKFIRTVFGGSSTKFTSSVGGGPALPAPPCRRVPTSQGFATRVFCPTNNNFNPYD